MFLLAAPITSLATLGVVRREMGGRALLCYLAGILLGLAVDLTLTRLGIDVIGQIGAVREVNAGIPGMGCPGYLADCRATTLASGYLGGGSWLAYDGMGQGDGSALKG